MKNKTILRAMAVAIFATVLIFSCSKKEMRTQDSALNYKLPNDVAKHVILQNGLLKFENRESFDLVLRILESENKRHSNLLREHCDYLAKQSIEFLDVLKIAEFAVYEAFEEAVGFKSLRAKIVKDEVEWLNNKELDLANDPDNHCIVGNEVRTLFNENGEIMIGNSIYKVGGNWLVYEIVNGDFQILRNLRDNDFNEPNNQYVTIHNQESNLKSDSCKLNKDKVYYTNYAINYRAKCRVTITNAVFFHYAKAETTHYKMNNNGGWDKEPADLLVYVQGYVRDTDCDDRAFFQDYEEEENTKSISAKVNFSTTVKAKNGEINSDHYVNGNNIAHVILDW